MGMQGHLNQEQRRHATGRGRTIRPAAAGSTAAARAGAMGGDGFAAMLVTAGGKQAGGCEVDR